MSDSHHGVGVGRQGAIESVSISDAGVDRLKPGAIGLMGVIFVAVTGAAPISAMLFNVPFATGFGTGYYTPAAFLFAAVVLTIFSVGYVTMARDIRAAGGFYSFISHGLGRELGLAAGICGGIAYSLFEVSLLGGFAYFFSTNFNTWFGWEIPWILPAVGAAALIAVLCWFDVELSVKVLGIALVAEIVILTLFDVLVLGQGGDGGIAFSSLDVTKLQDPGVGLAAGVGVFLAFWSWVGFEAIPNYAEESKDPKRNIPRATLIAVIGLGIGYVLTSLAFESAFPRADVVQAAQDPAGPFFVAMDKFGPHIFTIFMQVLILTGSFACAMAFHNVTMRYFYATGREGILPSALGRTHGKHEVPHIANITQTVIAVVIMLLWGAFSGGYGFGQAFDGAYVRVYTMMAVQGVVWILAIQAVCALAIIVWYRTGGRSGSIISTVICPIIAIIAQVFAIYLLFKNITAISFDITYTHWIMWIAIVVTAVTLIYAFVLRSTNREKFDKIGRVIDDTGSI